MDTHGEEFEGRATHIADGGGAGCRKGWVERSRQVAYAFTFAHTLASMEAVCKAVDISA